MSKYVNKNGTFNHGKWIRENSAEQINEGSVSIGKIKVFNNRNATGTGLYQALDSKQNKIVSAWVDDNQDKIDVLHDMSYDTRLEEKYSETAVIQFAGRLFTLYSSYGVYRIGAGGKLSSGKVMDGIVDKFVAACK